MFKKMLRKIYRSRDSIYQDEIMSIVKNNQNVILLDVRSKQEYDEGHLKGAINIPIYELEYRAENELKNKQCVVIAYCSAGIRSRKALGILRKLGYQNLYNVEDGVRIFWKNI